MSCGDPDCFACPECLDGYEPAIEPIRGVPMLHGLMRQLEEIDRVFGLDSYRNPLGIPRELVDPVKPHQPVEATSMDDGVHDLLHEMNRRITDPVCADLLRLPHERRP